MKCNQIASVFLFALSLLTLSSGLSLKAQTIYSIGLYHSQALKMIMLTPVEGEYKVWNGDSLILTLKKNDIINLSVSDGFIKVQGIERFFGLYTELVIEGHLSRNTMRIKSVIPGKDARLYPDNFHLKVKDQTLQLVNRVSSPRYIAGVVEAEGGPSAPFEYYKAQVLLCRTYVQGHLHKHRDDGFQLCDGVHCQAYHGIAQHNDLIPLAVEETGSEVVVDFQGKLITAAYHSNCGGQTVNSEHVWVQALSYLQSIEEHYCLSSPNARWESEISLNEWLIYLQNQGINLNDTLGNEEIAFIQKQRKQFYIFKNDSLELKRVRSDWKLKSTFFDLISIDETVFLDGKGYGHGVGLCQEGAMSMARNGYNYREIIQHYYKDVKIISGN